MPQHIYKIANTVNDLIYVGQTGNIHKRWLRHRSEANKGSTRPLYCAMREYGLDSFYPELIEANIDYANAYDRETYWIRILNTAYPCGYNAQFPRLTNTEAAVIKYDAWGWTLYQYATFFSAATKWSLTFSRHQKALTRNCNEFLTTLLYSYQKC